MFDHAWPVVWRQIQWPHDTDHRRQWKRALEWSRDEWRAAFELLPSAVEPAVDALPAA